MVKPTSSTSAVESAVANFVVANETFLKSISGLLNKSAPESKNHILNGTARPYIYYSENFPEERIKKMARGILQAKESGDGTKKTGKGSALIGSPTSTRTLDLSSSSRVSLQSTSETSWSESDMSVASDNENPPASRKASDLVSNKGGGSQKEIGVRKKRSRLTHTKSESANEQKKLCKSPPGRPVPEPAWKKVATAKTCCKCTTNCSSIKCGCKDRNQGCSKFCGCKAEKLCYNKKTVK